MPWDDGTFYPPEERVAEVLDEAGLTVGEAWIHSTGVEWRDKFRLDGETFWVKIMYWPMTGPNSAIDTRKLFVQAATATDRLKGETLVEALRHLCETLEASGDFKITPEEPGNPFGGHHPSPWKQGGEMRMWSLRILDDNLIM